MTYIRYQRDYKGGITKLETMASGAVKVLES